MHAGSTALYSYFWLVAMVSLLQWVAVFLSLDMLVSSFRLCISFFWLDTSFIWLVTYSFSLVTCSLWLVTFG